MIIHSHHRSLVLLSLIVCVNWWSNPVSTAQSAAAKTRFIQEEFAIGACWFKLPDDDKADAFYADVAAAHFNDFFCQFQDVKFIRVSRVNRTDYFFLIHHSDHAFDQVVDIAERSGLFSVAIHGDILSFQSLDDEVGYHPAIIGHHSWAVGVEDSYHPYVYIILPVIIEKQCFSAALAFIVASSRANGVNVTPVILWLRVNFRIAVNF